MTEVPTTAPIGSPVVAAASRALRTASPDALVVVETVAGPRFPNGVVGSGSGTGIETWTAVAAPVRARRWWDPRCHVRDLAADRVRALVTGTDPLVLPAEPADCIGWGPGSTPAGDDVVVGLLIGLRATGRDREADELATATAGFETTPLSRALLDHAAVNEAVRPVLDLVEALAGRRRLAPAVARLTGLGATSGRHLLDGVRRSLIEVGS